MMASRRLQPLPGTTESLVVVTWMVAAEATEPAMHKPNPTPKTCKSFAQRERTEGTGQDKTMEFIILLFSVAGAAESTSLQ